MSDENKTKTDKWVVAATHVFWLCIVAALIYFDNRDDRLTLKRVGEIEAEAKALLSKAEKLNDETSRFDLDNWRDVVPDVKEAAENLLYSAESLHGEIGELEEYLTPSEGDPGD